MAVASEELDAICGHGYSVMWWVSAWFVVHMVRAGRDAGPKNLAEVNRTSRNSAPANG